MEKEKPFLTELEKGFISGFFTIWQISLL